MTLRHSIAAAPSRSFDWLMAVLAALVVAGVFQDGWAHNHGLVDQSFFTPWHAVLYGTMAVNGLVLLGYGIGNLRRGYTFANALPYGYWLSAAGVCLFLVGGLLDLLWHTLFGIEENINALVSPTHLLLALAGAFVICGPIRSVARQLPADAPAAWRRVGPAIVATASLVSLLGFFTMYADPIGSAAGARVIGQSGETRVVGNLYVMRADGTRQMRVFSTSTADQFGGTVSPDGKWLAYRSADRADWPAQIVVARTDGANPRTLTRTRQWNSQPAWSPDSQHIAFVALPNGTSGDFALMIVDRATAHLRTLVRSVAEINGPAWSADGATIAYGTRNGLHTEIATVRVKGGTPSTFVRHSNGGSFPAYSHDGKLLAFTVSSGAQSGIVVADSDGANAHLVISDGSMPAFSPRSDRIAYVKRQHGVSDVWVASLARRTRTNVSHLSGLNALRPQWTTDGHLLYTASANGSVYDTDIAQAFALDTFLITGVLLSGAVLVLLRRFTLPFGAVTTILLMFCIEQATQYDHYFALWAAFATAIAADAAVAWARIRIRDGAPFYAFAFGMPALFSALFLLAVRLHHGGLGWPANMTFGTPVLAGFAGLLVAFCCVSPLPIAMRPGDSATQATAAQRREEVHAALI